MIKLSSEFSIENFVETGTYQGATAVWAAEPFKQVFTIELSKPLYEESRRKYDHLANVKFIFGDSREELKKLAGTLKKSSIYWLDAHWSGGTTYGDNDQCQLIEEIKIIVDSEADNFIFIDDARLFTSPPPHRVEQWPDLTTLIKILQGAEGDRYIVIIEDVIIAVPAFAKEVVSQYCQNVNAKHWAEYGRQNKKSNVKKGLEQIYTDLLAALKKPVRAFRKIYKFAKKDK